jgi:YaiO family outer membrane protein
MKTNYLMVLSLSLFFSYSLGAQQVSLDVTRQEVDGKNVSDAHSQNLEYSTSLSWGEILLSVQRKDWTLGTNELKDTSFSGVAYYGKGDLVGVSEIQKSGGDLFNRYSLTQGVGYKTLEDKSLILYVGLGHRKFNDLNQENVANFGPVFYFKNGNIGYSISRTISDNEKTNKNQSIFASFSFNNNQSILDLRLNHGTGGYLVSAANATTLLGTDLRAKGGAVSYKYVVSKNFAAKLSVGRDLVNDRVSGDSIYTSNTFTLGLEAKL